MTNKDKYAILSAFLFLALAPLKAYAQEAQPATPGVHEIPMTCKKYSYSPNPIRVKKGEHVRLVITCSDHDHGIKLDEFHIEAKLKKGVPTPVEFTPDQTGTFTFKCSVHCGIGHNGMKGTLIVEE
ncbi:MAG TPA: cupredoxin domain-containing protein [Candidatus Angelobacter sp.]|nr:cupredoxin domain-containing protein [Candidatus Angelobacter sp.]